MQPEDPLARWWPVDEATGKPTSRLAAADPASQTWLGDEALDEAGMAADNVEATFGASHHFSDVERWRLIHEREVPASVRPYAEAAADLIECVDDLWASVEQIYRDRWGRLPTSAERRLIGTFAAWVLSPGHDTSGSPIPRPPSDAT